MYIVHKQRTLHAQLRIVYVNMHHLEGTGANIVDNSIFANIVGYALLITALLKYHTIQRAPKQ